MQSLRFRLSCHKPLRPSSGVHAGLRLLLLVLVAGLAGTVFVAGCKQPPAQSAPASNPAAGPEEVPPVKTPAPTAGVPASAASPVPSAAQGAPAPSAAPGSPASASAAPAPPPPSPPPVYTVPRGTPVAVRVSETLSAKQSDVGETFHGTLVRALRVNGMAVLPEGTAVAGQVVAAKGQGRFKGQGILAIELTRIGSQPVTTSTYEKTVGGKGKRSAGFIGGGGGGGALLGGLAGGGKGALIGGLIGGGAGAAGAGLTGGKDVTIGPETVVTFTLRRPLTIRGASQQP